MKTPNNMKTKDNNRQALAPSPLERAGVRLSKVRLYVPPATTIISVEAEGIIATSIGTYDDAGHEITGPGRAKSFWDNDL